MREEQVLGQQVGRRFHKYAKSVGFGKMDVEANERLVSLVGRIVLILPYSHTVEERVRLLESSLKTSADLEDRISIHLHPMVAGTIPNSRK